MCFNLIMLLDLDKIKPDSIAAIDSDENILTYSAIIDLSKELKNNFPERSLFFIYTGNNIGGIAFVMATIIAGHVPLILNAHTEQSLKENLEETYKPQYICNPGDETNPDALIKAFGYEVTHQNDLKLNLNPELSHLLPTSGSTGSPKLVRHKYENIEAAALNISTLFNLSEKDRPLMVLPLYYTMGLSMIFSHLKVGATVLITDRKMTDPIFWKFIKEKEATSFTGVPFSYEILDKMRFFRMNLPHLTLLTQGGGKMPLELNRKFVEYCIANGKRWIATYGQSEGTARMAWLPEEYALSKIGSIGIAVPNGRLSLRNESGEEIIESPATGEMCYEGKNVTMGYATQITDLALGDERMGFLATGDIAYRDEEGFYFIKGRMGRFLKLYGNRIGLDECEQILKSKITCECACTGNDDKLIVYLTEEKESQMAATAIIDATRIPGNSLEIRIIRELPKNEAGKILYSQLKNS